MEMLRGVVSRAVPRAGPDPLLLLRHGGGAARDTDQAIVLDVAGHPVAVLKVARAARASELLRGEHDRLVRLGATLLPLRPGAAPRPLAFEAIAGRAVLVESFLPGRRIKDMDPHDLERRTDLLDAVVDWLADFARAGEIATVALDGPLLDAQVREPVERYLASFEASGPERVFLRSLPDLLLRAFPASAPTVAMHGDFSDANVLASEDRIGVVDWDEPVARALPGADLFYFLASVAATRRGLDDPGRFRKGFLETFFHPTPAAARARRASDRYRARLRLPRAALVPLFSLAWVRFALFKLDYLNESGLRHAPGSSYPVTVFLDGRCLNVSLTAAHSDRLEL
jgi:aminoglycoside phosphotransferase (APT) family kinase protein